ncbi:hypothetical protein GIB67_042396 [Kingdonia uniflora]|uniref:ABC-2 type transporter transmembrane domain-containing protein n=1 Tax=Kingdonia uniflora TaxID=39325 RepID=A0A7J7M844_9MAGN|nr:hypothetical protein GIB67_042396 [Kingdonia uniflora]
MFARGAAGAFITGFMTFMSIGGFPSFVEEMKVTFLTLYMLQRLFSFPLQFWVPSHSILTNKSSVSGYYGIGEYILSNFLSSFPYLVAISFTSGTIAYFMVKFHPEFSHYVYYCLNVFNCIAVMESLMMIVASLVPNYLMGIVTGAGIIGILMMPDGFFRFLPDLPKLF